ncbi:MAG: double-strand break repair helicase AddA [Pseudorhodoplanes sp.]|nr:double-strand break repair helicase AddA [Pseudorhodoplanes sp.]
MSRPRTIPDSVRERQSGASDPEISAFVAANAGSGKTHVLAQRVIRLLLKGVAPEKILCLTFTKAAAANMASRVFDTLRAWIALDDPALAKAIRDNGTRVAGAAELANARRLFAQAIETPGGLKIQTIHAFCTRLLHQFPFEADVANRFAVLDERATKELLDRTMLAVLLDAAAAPESATGRALAAAITVAADSTIHEAVAEAIGKRDRLIAWVERAGGFDAAIAELSPALGIAPHDTLAQVEAEIVDGPIFPSCEWAAIADLCSTSSPRDKEQCNRLRTAASAAGTARIDEYLRVFFDSKDNARTSILTKPLATQHPELARKLALEQDRLVVLRDKRRAVICRERSVALLTIAHAVIEAYRAEKARRGVLDYDDLIDKTLAMLSTRGPSWVHYKLDAGIDHVLIDEAQDTSPKQWEIVSRLVSEFASGAGARGTAKRTIFAVGDEKQSIFSFQGAAPDQFDLMRREFTKAFDRPEYGWRFVRLQHSFRSGANVLGAVDEVFRQESVYVGVTSDTGGIPRHEALPDTAPGLVEIWDLEKPDDKPAMEGWDAPFDEMSRTNPQVKLAERIARHVKKSIADGVRARDTIVLVRQRGPLFEAIIRALKRAGVPVAGADRLKLAHHVAVEDLIALADAALLPEDDLALAVALKSPLVGFDEDQLFDLAWDRNGAPLRQALLAKHPDLAAWFDSLAQAARAQTPFAFYSGVLNRDGGRRRFFARLGLEAADAIDEFMTMTLAYESRETPSLQGFVAWMRAAETEVKRDMDIARDEVRVMTVHGAKGLEAHTVILADTTTPPAGSHPPKLLMLTAPNAAPGASDCIVWAAAKTTDSRAVAAARRLAVQADENEYRRLLYVAMTRAAHRLIVCGFQGDKARPQGCWYDLVRNALEGATIEEQTEDGPIRVYRKHPAETDGAAASDGAKAGVAPEPLWLRRAAPSERLGRRVMSPSDSPGRPLRATPAEAATRGNARARGTLMHRLLQSLPDLEPVQRKAAAERFLARASGTFGEIERADMVVRVLRIFDDPRFAALFAPGSRAEVPVVGRLPGTDIAIAGQIDRLAVTDCEVLLADYKTDRIVPERPQDVPHYVRQLALYRALLGLIYPGRPVRAALLFTAGPDLMNIPATLLDAEIATLTSA